MIKVKIEGTEEISKTIKSASKASQEAEQEVKEIESKSKTPIGKDERDALIKVIDDPTYGQQAAKTLIEKYNTSQEEAADELAAQNLERILSKLLEIK